MCALTAAFDFTTDILKLSTTTLGQLIEIQLEDLSTFVARQRAAADQVATVRDVSGLIALQRNYRDAFWNDRLNALVAAGKTLQVALERVGHRVRESTQPDDSAADEPKAQTPVTRAKSNARRTKTPKPTEDIAPHAKPKKSRKRTRAPP
jgi:hypothetical protein